MIFKFATIGDYGSAGTNELLVSQLVNSWNVNFIITLGDNNYENGASSTIDPNIGQYYHQYIYPYAGNYGNGDTVNRFFPCLGNHDWVTSGALPYLNYFSLPNIERYYDFVKGNIHFFAIDSDPHESSGTDSNSIQAQWLKAKLAISTEKFKIVYFHHSPYSSGEHGNTSYMQWPFKRWGASIVLSGHDHTYERLKVNSFTFLINGLGGKSIYNFVSISPYSQFRYNSAYGAQLVTDYDDSINFKFYNINGTLIDSYTLVYVPTAITINETGLPDSFKMFQNYPNPFNPVTKIKFEIPSNVNDELSVVSLKVYNIEGKEVMTIVNVRQQSGRYEVNFDGTDFPSGVYYYKLTVSGMNGLQSREFSDVKKMLLIK